MNKVKIAFVGTGAISGIYLKNISETFKELEIVGVCDLVPERAQNAADFLKEKGIDAKIYKDMYEAFEDASVEIILNLTRPYEHFEVTKQALLHGKHVYTEKPLGITNDEGNALIALAEEKGLLLGGAPDTFMGAGIQTVRKLIDDGFIGDLVGANCAMVCHGHETWHPDPEFYYKAGGGPMLDMGPYYITALVQLLGEAQCVTGMTKKSFEHRLITSEPHRGETIDVDVDTYLTGSILFSNGAIAQVFTTFDVFYAGNSQARFEIYGTKGTIVVPDPNTFGGSILLYRPEDQQAKKAIDPGLMQKSASDFYRGYREMPLMFDYCENSRGLGLADMAKALRTGRDFRANYTQQRHVLEIMTAFSKSSETGTTCRIESKYARTAPMKNNPMHGILDD